MVAARRPGAPFIGSAGHSAYRRKSCDAGTNRRTPIGAPISHAALSKKRYEHLCPGDGAPPQLGGSSGAMAPILRPSSDSQVAARLIRADLTADSESLSNRVLRSGCNDRGAP